VGVNGAGGPNCLRDPGVPLTLEQLPPLARGLAKEALLMRCVSSVSARSRTSTRHRIVLRLAGIPEFLSRSRVVPAGSCHLEGRAWSGGSEIAGVEVSTDGGETWAEAELGDDSLGRWAWRGWRFVWDADAGEYELYCRARDAAGNVQPLDPPWNLGGYMNNAVQRVAVTVAG